MQSKSRIEIQYDVETEDGVQKKELPFVIGVMGDFTGNAPARPLEKFKDRDFISITNTNFNQVMQHISPGIQYRVNNHISKSDSDLQVSLQFNSMDDFKPEQIIEHVPALKKLKQTRDRLRDLIMKADCSSELESSLSALLKDDKAIRTLAAQMQENDDE